jgi:DNA-binding transcriptional LysR family regulator
MPEVLLRLALNSQIEVTVTHRVDDAACASVAGNHVDAALVSGPAADAPLVGHRLVEDPLVLLVAADAPLARRGSAPRLSEIAALPLIGRSSSRDVEPAFTELEQLGAQPRIAYATDDDATTHALVASGLGAAILPALAANWDDDDVAALPLEGVARPRTLSLVWHGDRELSPALETFCDETIAACRGVQQRLDERLSALGPDPDAGATAAA